MKYRILLLIPALIINLNHAFGQTLISNPTATNNQTNYCQGGEGVEFGVNNAVVGNSYSLQLSATGIDPWTVVNTISANQAQSWFTGKYTTGYYRIQGTTTVIQAIMRNLPEKFNVQGGGGYCAGFPQAFVISLSNSVAGINYQLRRDGSNVGNPVPGNGGQLPLGSQTTAGTYTVLAVNQWGCENLMTGQAVIEIYPALSVTFAGIPQNECSSTPVIFTATITGGTPPFNYAWDFTGTGQYTSAQPNPGFVFPAFGNGIQGFDVSLIVTDSKGCTNNHSASIIVKQRPHASLNDTGFPKWAKCDPDPAATYTITVANNSSTTPTNQQYVINWGDGSTIETFGSGFTGATHTYVTKGSFPLSIQVTGQNGCIDTKTYNVFNGSTPTYGINNTELVGCAPLTVTFTLPANAYDNTPGTYYYFDFGDGITKEYFQEDLPPPIQPGAGCDIVHIYESSSCNINPSHSFTMSSYVKNPCDSIPYTAGGIKVSKAPVASFEINRFPLPGKIFLCQNISHTFQNTTTKGCLIAGSPPQVNDITSYSWNFGDELGTSNLEFPSYTYTNAGTYFVTLVGHTAQGQPGNCGTNTSVREICVQAPPVAEFTIPANPGCGVFEFTPSNTSYSNDCAVVRYHWTVDPDDGYIYVAGNQQSKEPTFRFYQGGEYTLSLRAYILSANTICFNDFKNISFTLKNEPVVIVYKNYFELCGPGEMTFSNSILDYNNNNSAITSYEWKINGAVASTLEFPTLNFPAYGTYNVTVKATNECGDSELATFTVQVNHEIANNTIVNTGLQNICSGMWTDTITGTGPDVLTGGNETTYDFLWKVLYPGSANPIDIGYDQNLPPVNLTILGITKFHRVVSSGGCESISNIIELNVVEGISNNTIQESQIICRNTVPDTITGSTPTGGGTNHQFKWYKNEGFGWDEIMNSYQATFTPPALTVTTQYMRNVFTDACDLDSNPVTITVNEYPVLNTVNSDPICNGATFSIPLSTDITGSVFNWVVAGSSNAGMNPASAIDATEISGTVVNTSKAKGTVTFNITPRGPLPTRCQGNTSTFILSVMPTAAITNTETEQTIGSQEFTQPVTFSNDITDPDLTVTYNWTGIASHPAITNWDISGNGSLPSMQIYIDTDVTGYPSVGWVEYTVIPATGECEGTPFVYTIHILLYPVIYTLSAAVPEFCEDGVSCASISLSGSQTGVTYRLFRNGIHQVTSDEGGTGGPIEWCVQEGGTYTVNAKNNTTGATIDMDGSVEITSRPLPLQYSLTALEPYNQCVPVTPRLNNSQTGAQYFLIRMFSGSEFNIQELNGNGDFLQFNSQTEPGVYTVRARIQYNDIFCERLMTGSIIANPLPLVFETIPAGPFCESDSIELCLTATEDGVKYRLWKDNQTFGTIVDGTGGSVCLGIMNVAGSYKVHAKNPVTNCDIFFPDEGITVNPSPLRHNMSPAEACPGVEIVLTECEENTTYYLHFEAAKSTGSKDVIVESKTCQQSGFPLVFSPQYNEGVYTVKAVNDKTCPSWMVGSATVFSLPELHELSPSAGKYCTYDSIEIGLKTSDVQISYELHRTNAAINPVSVVAGTGNPISFGTITRAGIYRIKAITSKDCERWMDGTITISNSPVSYNVLANGEQPVAGWLCPPAAITLQASEQDVRYILYRNNDSLTTFTGTGNAISFGLQEIPGTYTIYAYNPVTNCSAPMANFIGLYESPEIFTLQSSRDPAFYCAGSTNGVDLSLNQTQPGVIYQLYKGSLAIFGPISGDATGGPIQWNNASMHGAGLYRVIATFPDDPECDAVMNGTINMMEVIPPIAGFKPNQNNCLSQEQFELEILLTANLSVNVVYSDGQSDHTVTFNPANFPHTITVNPNVTTNYHLVGVTYATLDGCDGFITGPGVKLFSIPEVSFSYHQQSNCDGKIQFHDESSGGDNTPVIERQWKFGTFNTSQSDPIWEFPSSGSHSITLKVKDQRGCWNEKTENITVTEFFNFNILNSNVCNGQTIFFSIDPGSIQPPGNSIISYHWNFGDGSAPLYFSNPSHKFSSPGNYEVSLHAQDHTGCKVTGTKVITVPVAPESDFGFKDCNIEVDFYDSINLQSISIVKWKWYFGDDTSDSVMAPNKPVIRHIYPRNGNYQVLLVITDINGCSDTSMIKTIRTECFDILGFYVPTAFAPDHVNEEVRIFKPKGINILDYQIEVFDIWGNLLWESDKLDEEGSPTEAWDGTYNGKPLQQGAYVWRAFVKFRDGSIWYLDKEKGTRTGTVTLIR